LTSNFLLKNHIYIPKEEKMAKSLKETIRQLVRETIEEELRIKGEEEAIGDIQNWLTIGNPHGVTKQELIRYLNKDLAKKYGREAVMLAFDTIKKDKGCLVMKKLKDGRQVVKWAKNC
jgi:hypothetical protein